MATETGEEDLVAGLGRGDPEALAQLFDRYADRIYNHCFRATGSWVEAEDATATVFLEVWRHRQRVRIHDGSALPWLYGVAKLTLHRRRRTTLRYRRALARLPATVTAPDHADAVAARLDDERHLAQLQVAFAGLRAVDQEVLTLCVWQGLDYASAAVALGVPIGTVRSRLSRARARLQEATAGESTGVPLSPQPSQELS